MFQAVTRRTLTSLSKPYQSSFWKFHIDFTMISQNISYRFEIRYRLPYSEYQFVIVVFWIPLFVTIHIPFLDFSYFINTTVSLYYVTNRQKVNAKHLILLKNTSCLQKQTYLYLDTRQRFSTLYTDFKSYVIHFIHYQNHVNCKMNPHI